MPYLNRDRIRVWLEDHNWSVDRLTVECNTLGEDDVSAGTMRNVVNDIDPMRPGRIKLICRATAKYGDGLSYAQLIATDQVGRRRRRRSRDTGAGSRREPKGLWRVSSGTTLTEQAARRLLGEVCARVDLDPTGADLVRLGSNAVFRLTEPVVVRIAGDGTTVDDVRRQVLVARWLADVGYPATRALDVDQPVEVDGYVATLLVSVSDRDEYAPIRDVADLIRRLHELDPPRGFDLPPFRPFDGLDERLVGMTDADKAFVANRLHQLRERYDNLTFALPPGVIHGDANVGNVILTRDGKPVMIDLDSFAVGPREWDLVQTALFYERFGWHTAEEYRTFVDVYGFDIMTWPGYPVLADYREISMTLWLAGKAENDESAAAEVRKRVEAIRTDGSRRDWAPF